MTAQELKKATERYNDIMMDICYEHSTIGTRYSEDTEGWNLRDMVAECDYCYGTYFECGHCNEEMRHGDEYERAAWRRESGRLKRFIDRYAPMVKGMTCTSGHCSKYDIKRR